MTQSTVIQFDRDTGRDMSYDIVHFSFRKMVTQVRDVGKTSHRLLGDCHHFFPTLNRYRKFESQAESARRRWSCWKGLKSCTSA